MVEKFWKFLFLRTFWAIFQLYPRITTGTLGIKNNCINLDEKLHKKIYYRIKYYTNIQQMQLKTCGYMENLPSK